MELILQSHTVTGKLMRLHVETVYLDAHCLWIYHNLCDNEQVNSYFVTTQTREHCPAVGLCKPSFVEFNLNQTQAKATGIFLFFS